MLLLFGARYLDVRTRRTAGTRDIFNEGNEEEERERETWYLGGELWNVGRNGVNNFYQGTRLNPTRPAG